MPPKPDLRSAAATAARLLAFFLVSAIGGAFGHLFVAAALVPVDLQSQLNPGLLTLLLAIVCCAAIAWIHPEALAWIGSKCFARRAYILSGRVAQREEWSTMEERYGLKKPSRQNILNSSDREPHAENEHGF